MAHKNVHSLLQDKYLTESLLLVFFHSILTFHHAMCCQMTKRKKLKRQQHFIQYFSYSTSHVLLLLKLLFDWDHCKILVFVTLFWTSISNEQPGSNHNLWTKKGMPDCNKSRVVVTVRRLLP